MSFTRDDFSLLLEFLGEIGSIDGLVPHLRRIGDAVTLRALQAEYEVWSKSPSRPRDYSVMAERLRVEIGKLRNKILEREENE